MMVLCQTKYRSPNPEIAALAEALESRTWLGEFLRDVADSIKADGLDVLVENPKRVSLALENALDEYQISLEVARETIRKYPGQFVELLLELQPKEKRPASTGRFR